MKSLVEIERRRVSKFLAWLRVSFVVSTSKIRVVLVDGG
jgi:hypothetical protein